MSGERAGAQKLSMLGVGRDVLGTYRTHAWPLLFTAALVFGPITLLEAVSEPLREVEGGDGFAAGEALGVGLLIAAFSLVGEVFYAGVVAAIVIEERGGHMRSLREVARELPYLKLLAVDLLFILLVLAGVIALIVPALFVIAWWGLAGPVLEIEHTSVRGAFRRSREISRGHGLRILALLVPLLLIGDALGEAAHASGLWILGDGVGGHWLGGALTEILTAPLFGLAAAITAHHLIAFRSAPSP